MMLAKVKEQNGIMLAKVKSQVSLHQRLIAVMTCNKCGILFPYLLQPSITSLDCVLLISWRTQSNDQLEDAVLPSLILLGTLLLQALFQSIIDFLQVLTLQIHLEIVKMQ